MPRTKTGPTRPLTFSWRCHQVAIRMWRKFVEKGKVVPQRSQPQRAYMSNSANMVKSLRNLCKYSLGTVEITTQKANTKLSYRKTTTKSWEEYGIINYDARIMNFIMKIENCISGRRSIRRIGYDRPQKPHQDRQTH